MKQLSKMKYTPDPNAKVNRNQDLVITDQAKAAVDKLFTALEAIFPAWRATLKSNEEIKTQNWFGLRRFYGINKRPVKT